MDSSLATIERKDSFAIIRLNQAENFSALSQVVISTLIEAFKNLEAQSDLRSVILTGTTDKALDSPELAELTTTEIHEVSEGARSLYNQIHTSRVPVIAAIDGLAAGTGFELTFACHLRIASPDASFSFPETWLASIRGAGELQKRAREIGSDHLREISQSGGVIRAKEALRIGLINRIAPEGRLLIEAELLASQISSMAPLAIRACLEAVTRGIELPLDEGLVLESKLFAGLFATDDVREGASAFLEKRQPAFKGS